MWSIWEAVRPNIHGVDDESVLSAIKLVFGNEEMKRSHGDALDCQPTASAMNWKGFPQISGSQELNG